MTPTTTPNAETMRALAELREKRDQAKAQFDKASKRASEARVERERMDAAHREAADAYEKAVAEVFGLGIGQ